MPNLLAMPLAGSLMKPPQQQQAAPQPQPAPSNFSFAPPKPKENLLSSALDGFQRGFDPAGYQNRMNENKAQQSDDIKTQIATLQQVKALPMQQRLSIIPQLSQAIGQDVPQSMLSDEEIDKQLALMMGQAGVAPEQPEYMNLGGGNVGKVAGGKFSMAHEAPPDPTNTKLTTEIGANGNYWSFDTASGTMKDTGVKAPPKQGSQANLQTKVGSNGNYWTFDPNSGQMKDTGVPAPAKSGNGIQLEFDENGGISGLSIGGTGTKGNESAIVRGPNGEKIVAPSKQQSVTNKAASALKEYEAQNATVVEDVDRALNLAGFWTTGLVGSAAAQVPGTPAHDLANILNTIKSNVGFDKLKQMRDESPTGGAVGNVSDQENKLLQSVLGALEQSQSEAQFRYHLGRLKRILEDKEGRRRAAFAHDYPTLTEYAGFAKDAAAEGNALQKMSEEDLRKRLAQLKGGQ